MMHIAVCDDSPPFTSELEHLLTTVSHKENIPVNIDIFFDGSTLFQRIQSGTIYDLIYMDIRMSGMDGIQTAHLIRDMKLPVLLIYISAYDKYYKQLFDVEPFRFLSKPVDRQLFLEYFIAAYKKLKKEKLFYTFRFNQAITKVTVADIIFLESDRRYVIIHTVRQDYRFIGKLDDTAPFFLEDGLNFLRIHQSFLINPYYIHSISLSEVQMSSGHLLKISDKYQEAVRKQYLFLIEDL